MIEVNFANNSLQFVINTKMHSYSKLYYQVTNLKERGTVNDVHVYCMYNGTDSHFNIDLVWGSLYYDQVRQFHR